MGLFDYTYGGKTKSVGGLLGELWDSFGNNPRNAETVDAMKGMVGLLPLSAGDIASGVLAVDDARRGDYVNATLNGLGALPLVPALGGMISSKGDDVAKAISQVDDYAGLHRPPMKGSGAPLHDLTGGGDFYPDDVYSANGLRYYGTGDDRVDREVWNLAMQVKGKPDAKVKMYRAVPYEKTNAEKIAELEKQKAAFMKRGKVPDNSGFTNGSKWYEWASGEIDRLKNAPESAISPEKINHGDWVTTSRQYAKDHGESALGGNYKILSQTVPARKLFTNGDSWAEFGYDETGRINPQLLPWLVGGGLLGTAGISYYSE
jgi:hypothetical protein